MSSTLARIYFPRMLMQHMHEVMMEWVPKVQANVAKRLAELNISRLLHSGPSQGEPKGRRGRGGGSRRGYGWYASDSGRALGNARGWGTGKGRSVRGTRGGGQPGGRSYGGR
jgi:hypothetical protein